MREIVKIRCSYCGSMYNENQDYCPHCDAKRERVATYPLETVKMRSRNIPKPCFLASIESEGIYYGRMLSAKRLSRCCEIAPQNVAVS